MWQLRALFPLHFLVFKQTASHLAAEANVEQVFSRAGQLSEVNLDPDSLADMVSIMINKHTYKPSHAMELQEIGVDGQGSRET